jgi:hypothetical protein
MRFEIRPAFALRLKMPGLAARRSTRFHPTLSSRTRHCPSLTGCSSSAQSGLCWTLASAQLSWRISPIYIFIPLLFMAHGVQFAPQLLAGNLFELERHWLQFIIDKNAAIAGNVSRGQP